MRPPSKKLLQTSALLTGAMALVFSSAGLAGATESNEVEAVVVQDHTAEQDAAQADKDKADKAQADKDKADREKAEKAQAEKAQADREKADKAQADKDKADRDNAGGDAVVGADKVTICHATGSATNPFVVITVSKNAILKAGHGDHEGDIIPAFDGFDGQNLDQLHLIDAGCELDDTTPGNGDDSDDGDNDVVVGADKVTICHATGSATNPFVVITVSKNAILKAGHGDHEGDIIPAFDGFDGQNLDQLHLIDAGCELDDTTPGNGGETPGNGGQTPTPVPEIENDTVTPEVNVEDDVVLNPVTPMIPAVPAVPAQPGVSVVTPAVPATPALFTSTGSPAPQVLGAQVTRTPGALAATGDSTTNLVPVGLGLLLLGFGIQRTSKRFGAARIG